MSAACFQAVPGGVSVHSQQVSQCPFRSAGSTGTADPRTDIELSHTGFQLRQLNQDIDLANKVLGMIDICGGRRFSSCADDKQGGGNAIDKLIDVA